MKRGRLLRWFLVLCCVLVGANPTERLGARETPPGSGALERADPAWLDTAIESAAAAKGLTPSPLCDDATFLRRVTLDLVGTIPGPDEVTQFLADRSPDKRDRMIDALLARKEWSEHWAGVIRQFFVNRNQKRKMQAAAMGKGIDQWLAERLQANTSYDQIVRELLTASGSFVENPATMFILGWEGQAEDLASQTGKVFCGVQIQCAQCHDHPFETWKQSDYYGMVAFFARTRILPVPEPAMELVRRGIPVQRVFMLARIAMGEAGPEGAAARFAGQGAGARGGGGAGPNGPGAGRQGAGGQGAGGMQSRMARLFRRMTRMGGQGGMDVASDANPGGLGGDARELIAQLRQALVDPATGKRREKIRPVFVVYDAPRGEAVIPDPKATQPTQKYKMKVGTTVPPRFLDGQTPPPDSPRTSRRQELAEWITSSSNPYFAREAVNRFFALLTGQGLVMPVDNINNPDQKELAPVLDKLAEGFTHSGDDLRWLMRLVCRSRTYQRSTRAAPDAQKDATYFTHSRPRPLTPEQLFAAFLQATGADSLARSVMGERFERFRDMYLRQFVFTFETDEAAEKEVFHESIPQALMLLNARGINGPVQAAQGTRLYQTLTAASSPRDRIDRLYLATLSRHPTTAEVRQLSQYVMDCARASRGNLPMLGEAGDPTGPSPPPRDLAGAPWQSPGEREAYEDILWALVACTEFIYNH